MASRPRPLGAPNPLARWRAVLCTLCLTFLASARPAVAGGAVPIALQAQLVSKVAAFDRNLPARAAGTVRVVLVEKPGNPDSSRASLQMAQALGALSDIAGMPKETQVLPLTTAAEVADACRSRHAAIVYLAPGLDDDVAAIANALRGVDVLSVAGMGAGATAGAVIAFDVDEGKPKVLVNLAHARAQNVALRAELLKIARIVE